VKRETKAFSEAVLKKSKPVRVECQLQKELTSCSVLLLKFLTVNHSGVVNWLPGGLWISTTYAIVLSRNHTVDLQK